MSKPLGKPDRIVVALGGNALGNNPVEQIEAVSNTAHALLGLIEQGNEIIITHGNGPQAQTILPLNRSTLLRLYVPYSC